MITFPCNHDYNCDQFKNINDNEINKNPCVNIVTGVIQDNKNRDIKIVAVHALGKK